MPEGESGSFRPTAIIKKIMAHLRDKGEASKTELRDLGKSQAVDLAIQILQEEGALMLTKIGKKHVYTFRSTCTYRLRKKTA